MKIPISKIKIGKRIRKDLGDIAGLAASIKELGLIHPIKISSNLELIAGLRRVKAVQMLGWTQIEATTTDIPNDQIKLKTEKDENIQRKDFTPLEALDFKRQLEELGPDELDKLLKTKGANLALSRREQLARILGCGHTTMKKVEEVAVAAEREPEKYAPIAKEMNETGNVDRAYKLLSKSKKADEEKNQSRKQHEYRWRDAIQRIYKDVVFLTNKAAFERLREGWDAEDTERYLVKLKQISKACNLALELLQKDLEEKTKIRRVK